jgi:hypothetical protein
MRRDPADAQLAQRPPDLRQTVRLALLRLILPWPRRHRELRVAFV